MDIATNLNPFLKNIKVVLRKRSTKKGNIRSTSISIGEEQYIFEPAIHKEDEYESVEFIQLIGNTSEYLSELTNTENRIFSYMLDKLVLFNHDYIIFNHGVIKAIIGLSHTNYTYNFIQKMIKYNILKHKEGDVYWLNPYKIYKGNRTKLKHWK